MSHNTDVLPIRRDTLQALYNAVLDGDEEGLATHAEPVQAARAILEQPAPALSGDDQVTALRRNGLSIDGDNAYKRDLIDTIVGALAFGKQCVNPPPAGHWGQQFWDIGRAEGEEKERLINQRDAILLQARVWAGEAKTQQAITREVGEILGGVPNWGPIAAGVEAMRQQVVAAQAENSRLRGALKFYADSEHYHFESDNWDSVSGEPSNILWHSDDPDYIEDGEVARAAVSATAQPAECAAIDATTGCSACACGSTEPHAATLGFIKAAGDAYHGKTAEDQNDE